MVMRERGESKCGTCDQKVIIRKGMTEYAEGIERERAIEEAVGVILSFQGSIGGAFGVTLISSMADAVAALSSSGRRRRNL